MRKLFFAVCVSLTGFPVFVKMVSLSKEFSDSFQPDFSNLVPNYADSLFCALK